MKTKLMNENKRERADKFVNKVWKMQIILKRA